MTTRTPRRTGTRAWKRLRATWAWHLTHIGPVECGAPWCHQLVTHDDNWHLGHPHDQPHSRGGRDEDATPWHQRCNNQDGARVSAENRRARAGQAMNLTPSRDW